MKKNAHGWTALCPAHDDHDPSLSVKQGTDGRCLLYCHAGCAVESICAAIGMTVRDLFPNGTEAAGTANPRPRIIATYDYRDEGGELLYQVVRYEPKRFRQRRPDGRGEWVYNVRNTRRVLYRLPELLGTPPADPVFVVEGERDADTLASHGQVATTCPGGGGKWSSSRYLTGLTRRPDARAGSAS